jgi:hypothetical protein
VREIAPSEFFGTLPPGLFGELGTMPPSGGWEGRSEVRSLPVGAIRQDAAVVGRARGQVLVEALRVPGGPIGVVLSRLASAERQETSLRTPFRSRGVDRATGLRETEMRTSRSEKAHESIGPNAHISRRVRISAGSKALKPGGLVNSWSTDPEHALTEPARGQRRRAAHGSAEGKGSGG